MRVNYSCNKHTTNDKNTNNLNNVLHALANL